jgi:hypothetical protein
METSSFLKNGVFRNYMVINRDFESLLKKNGLDDFNALMKFNKGEVIKHKGKYRFTIRFDLAGEEGGVSVYLKR